MRKLNSFFKRALCLLLVIAMLPIIGLAAEQQPFQLPDPLPAVSFSDVPAEIWFYDYVQITCALGLMQGITGRVFSPGGTVPLCQGITVAVRVYEQFTGRKEPEEMPDGPWYTYYVNQAIFYGLLPEALADADMNRPATRCELAAILYRALPEDCFTPVNTVSSIPDYSEDQPYWSAVIGLYRAGVLLGDGAGRFLPENSIRRSELAAILTRMVCPQYRIVQDTSPEEPVAGMDAFQLPEPMPVIPFTDVKRSDWYYRPIASAYALGLVEGMSDTQYRPNGPVTISQVIAVTVRIYEQYHGYADHFDDYAGNWYDYYIYQASYYGILPTGISTDDPNRIATRQELAAVLYEALPLSELPAVRKVSCLPDYDKTSPYWKQVKTLYEAGVLSGTNRYDTFKPDDAVRRSELATMITNLVIPSQRRSTALVSMPVIETIRYGESGEGRDLVAYRYGDGSNVMVLNFAIHGYEDCYARDGQLLVDTANALRQELELRYDALIRNTNWSVYIIPCSNPDGLADGTTQNGPGRCTLSSLDADGNRRNRGVDLNRCFPNNWYAMSSARNYNGTAPLQALEARYLAKLTTDVKGSGKNVLVDVHGWYQQTIVFGGRSNVIYQVFRNHFPQNSYTSFGSGSGYYSAWAGNTLGYDACLFEFPRISSASDFTNNGYARSFIDAIGELLLTYTSLT